MVLNLQKSVLVQVKGFPSKHVFKSERLPYAHNGKNDLWPSSCPKKNAKRMNHFFHSNRPKKTWQKKKNNGTSKPEFVIEIGRAHKCSQLNPYALP